MVYTDFILFERWWNIFTLRFINIFLRSYILSILFFLGLLFLRNIDSLPRVKQLFAIILDSIRLRCTVAPARHVVYNTFHSLVIITLAIPLGKLVHLCNDRCIQGCCLAWSVGLHIQVNITKVDADSASTAECPKHLIESLVVTVFSNFQHFWAVICYSLVSKDILVCYIAKLSNILVISDINGLFD